MTTEKELNAKQLENQERLNCIIANFYLKANASSFIKIQNELTQAYLEKTLNEEETDEVIKEHLQDVLFMANVQSEFLSELEYFYNRMKG